MDSLFGSEGPEFYQQAFARNAPYAVAGPYSTALDPTQEQAFQQWLAQNKVPFAPNAPISDYDMRGFFKAMQAGQVKPWIQGSHFPDLFKTPYDTSFSAESKYATPNNPFHWQGDTLMNMATKKPAFIPNMPTAEQEALQQPTIDPVWYAVLGGVLGPMGAAKALGGQLLQNRALAGLGPLFQRLSQYGIVPADAARWSDELLGHLSPRAGLTKEGLPREMFTSPENPIQIPDWLRTLISKAGAEVPELGELPPVR